MTRHQVEFTRESKSVPGYNILVSVPNFVPIHAIMADF